MIARVLKPTDGFCPKCGHNRNTSSVSSIDHDTHKSCQMCGAKWQEHGMLERAGWLPIESAPRDGTPVLVFQDCNGEPEYSVGYFNDYHQKWTDGEYTLDPTHWMPLPPPPTGD